MTPECGTGRPKVSPKTSRWRAIPRGGTTKAITRRRKQERTVGSVSEHLDPVNMHFRRRKPRMVKNVGMPKGVPATLAGLFQTSLCGEDMIENGRASSVTFAFPGKWLP